MAAAKLNSTFFDRFRELVERDRLARILDDSNSN